MMYLIRTLFESGLLKKDLDYHLMPASMYEPEIIKAILSATTPRLLGDSVL
jgi:hypothetical protein